MFSIFSPNSLKGDFMDMLDIINIILCVVLAVLIYKNRQWKYQAIVVVIFIIIVVSIAFTIFLT